MRSTRKPTQSKYIQQPSEPGYTAANSVLSVRIPLAIGDTDLGYAV